MARWPNDCFANSSKRSVSLKTPRSCSSRWLITSSWPRSRIQAGRLHSLGPRRGRQTTASFRGMGQEPAHEAAGHHTGIRDRLSALNPSTAARLSKQVRVELGEPQVEGDNVVVPIRWELCVRPLTKVADQSGRPRGSGCVRISAATPSSASSSPGTGQRTSRTWYPMSKLGSFTQIGRPHPSGVRTRR